MSTPPAVLPSSPPRRLPLQLSQRHVLQWGGDVALVLLGLLVEVTPAGRVSFGELASPLSVGATVALWSLVATAGDNYSPNRTVRAGKSVVGILKALLLVQTILTILPVVAPPFPASLGPAVARFAVTGSALALWRLACAHALRRPSFRRRAVILGTGEAARAIADVLSEPNSGYETVGFAAPEEAAASPDTSSLPLLGRSVEIPHLVAAHGLTDIVVAVPGRLTGPEVAAILTCSEAGVKVMPMAFLYEWVTGRIPVEHLGERWLESLPTAGDPGWVYGILKRGLDVVVSLTGLALFGPLLPLLAVAIKLDSRGPVFYRPERLGRGGRPFRLWKLRTMCADADRRGDPTFTSENDQRITRVGRWLRASHLDELPQFLNILAGEMSLVGPRPERQVPELEWAIPFYRARNTVRPGTAGWALIRQGYAEGIEGTLVKLQYDLYYIKHRSLYLDLVILLRTAVDMLNRQGR